MLIRTKAFRNTDLSETGVPPAACFPVESCAARPAHNTDTATVTSQYTRLAPTVDIAVVAGEVLVLNPIVWA